MFKSNTNLTLNCWCYVLFCNKIINQIILFLCIDFYYRTIHIFRGCLLNHSSLVDYVVQRTYGKNYPTQFYCIFPLVSVCRSTSQNITGCFWIYLTTYFLQGCSLYINFNFRSKNKLWKMCSLEDFETRLIFCVLNSSTHTKWNMQSSLLGQFFHLSLRLNSPPVSYVTTVDAAWKNTGSFIASQRYKKRNFIAQIYFVNAFKKVKIKKLANNTKKYKKLVHFS